MRSLAFLFFVASSATALAQFSANGLEPPRAEKKPVERKLHGDTFVDDYFWLREKTNPAVVEHLKRENAYADAVMAPTRPLQETLYKEIVGRLKETDLDVPQLDNGYYYYSRTVKGKQYPIFCRRKGSIKAKEQVILDLNVLGKGKPYIGLGTMEVSENGKMLAYSIDTSGYREYHLYIKDLSTGRVLPDRFGKVDGVVWANDHRTIYYTTEDASKRTNRLWRRVLGSSKAELLYEEKVRQYNLYAYPSKDHRYLFCMSESSETSECRFLSLSSGRPSLRVLEPRREGHRYYPDHRNGRFYLRTNDRAKEFRIVTTPVGKTGAANWTEFVPGSIRTPIQDLDLYRDFAIVTALRGAMQVFRVYDFAQRKWHDVAFQEASYSAGNRGNPEFDAKTVQLSYTSMVTPRSVYDYHLRSRAMKLLKRQEVLGYRASEYVSEFVWATARDGEKIPITLAYKKGARVEGGNPLFLEAYGAYGSPNRAGFDNASVSLMDRGFIVGIAHIRGGGEMGERWHESGKMKAKINTFRDFIDCADWLVRQDYTRPELLGITGGSAGGLTMGGVLNLRPDLCRAALVYVPFVDVVNTMLDESIPLTTQEFLEWGNPKIEEQYRWLIEYSPYDTLRRADYPAILTRTSLNDSQVPYWEPAKWVARLRDFKTDDRPLLLKTNLDAGHGGASGRYNAIRNTAYDLAFLITALGRS